MAKDPNAPKAPKVAFLETMVERLDKVINGGGELAFIHGEDGTNAESLENLGEGTSVDVRDALEWLATMLGNRTAYHKRRQIKQKRETELLREALQARGVDVKKLEKEAEDAADNSIIDE